jgi:hypothetical protein
MAKSNKQMKALRVNQDTHDLAMEVFKKVIVETSGEVRTINGAIKYVLDKYLKDEK